MQRWTGTGTGGRANVGVRRAVVLRFLASCPQQEIQIFMDLILAPFKHLCTGKLWHFWTKTIALHPCPCQKCQLRVQHVNVVNSCSFFTYEQQTLQAWSLPPLQISPVLSLWRNSRGFWEWCRRSWTRWETWRRLFFLPSCKSSCHCCQRACLLSSTGKRLVNNGG